MKYNIGDVVRIKPKTWWNKLEKDSDNFEEAANSFTKDMAKECYGMIGEIIKANRDNTLPYGINFGHIIRYFFNDWIESEVKKHNIRLKLLKNEV